MSHILNTALRYTISVQDRMQAIIAIRYLNRAIDQVPPDEIDTVLNYIKYLNKNFLERYMKYNIGDRKEHIVITAIEDKTFTIKCDCGAVEEVSSRNFNRRMGYCTECARAIGRRRAGQTRVHAEMILPHMLPAEVPNPLLLPVPELIKTGPENW